MCKWGAEQPPGKTHEHSTWCWHSYALLCSSWGAPWARALSPMLGGGGATTRRGPDPGRRWCWRAKEGSGWLDLSLLSPRSCAMMLFHGAGGDERGGSQEKKGEGLTRISAPWPPQSSPLPPRHGHETLPAVKVTLITSSSVIA